MDWEWYNTCQCYVREGEQAILVYWKHRDRGLGEGGGTQVLNGYPL